MIFLNLLIEHSLSDLDGVEYSKDKKILLSTPTNLPYYKVPKECEVISGGNSVRQSSFFQCISVIKTLDFEENSQLRCIYPYVFYQSSLEYVNLSNCHYLTALNYSLFKYNSQLKSIILPEGLKTLCSGCLFSATSLVSFSIPDSVECIQGYHSEHLASLNQCKSLETINISSNSNLIKIGDDNFAGSKLTSLYVPRNASDIALSLFSSKISNFTIHPDNNYYSFDGTALLSKNKETMYYLKYNTGMKYTVPSYIKKLYNFACRGNGLSEITLHSNITSIGSYCFGSTGLVSFVFPEGITLIESRLFMYCERLKNVTLASTITKIEYSAFSGCTSLESINLNNNITAIGNEAFYNCKLLKEFMCPQKLTSFGTGVFFGCSSLVFNSNGNKKFNVESGILFVDGTSAQECFSSNGEIVIPATCTKITKNVFLGKAITKVTINSNVSLEILDSAFKSTSIEEIELPKCLTKLGESCFESIKVLKSLTIPSDSKLTSIPQNCFKNCEQLNHLTLPDSIASIGDFAFYSCKALKTLDISKTQIRSIGKSAFELCGITSLTFPATVHYVDECCFSTSGIHSINMNNCILDILNAEVFSNCYTLSSVIFTDSVEKISTLAFKNCHSLLEIEFPLHMTDIMPNAFQNCVRLQKFTLKLNCDLNTIYGQAFSGCSSLKEIGVDDNDTKFVAVNGVLMSKGKTLLKIFLPASTVTIFVVPSTISEIGQYAFQGCSNLRTIVIPEGSINSVGYHSFEGCTSLSSLFLPPTLTLFGIEAFLNCPKLKKCGSVVYEHDDKTGAINAGIPEISFNTNCKNNDYITCKNIRKSSNKPNVMMLVIIVSVN